jgi:signal transduction histidine kinase
MAFSRRRVVRPTAENLVELIRGVEYLLEQAAMPALLDFQLAADTWPCLVDRSQFERALMNLVVNARDAMPNGGEISIATFNVPERQLERAVWPELAAGAYVACRVRDAGEGMSAAVLARLGEPFFTTKPEGAGTGLGLAQVHGFVQQSGGSVRIESAVGVGTSVTMLLPRAPDSPDLRRDAIVETSRSEAEAPLFRAGK